PSSTAATSPPPAPMRNYCAALTSTANSPGTNSSCEQLRRPELLLVDVQVAVKEGQRLLTLDGRHRPGPTAVFARPLARLTHLILLVLSQARLKPRNHGEQGAAIFASLRVPDLGVVARQRCRQRTVTIGGSHRAQQVLVAVTRRHHPHRNRHRRLLDGQVSGRRR